MIEARFIHTHNFADFIGSLRRDEEVIAHYEHSIILRDGDVDVIVAPSDVLSDCLTLSVRVYSEPHGYVASVMDEEGNFYYGMCPHAGCTAIQSLLCEWAEGKFA